MMNNLWKDVGLVHFETEFILFLEIIVKIIIFTINTGYFNTG